MKEPFVARIAQAYEHHSEKFTSILEPIMKAMADEMVKQAGFRDGETLLDLATGTGLTARTVEQDTGPTIGIFISLGVITRERLLRTA